MTVSPPAGPLPTGSLPTGPLTIGVVGAGTMGTGIARLFARAGHRLQLFDNRPGVVASWLAAQAEDAPSAESAEHAGSIVDAATLVGAVAGADLVIEVVAEDRVVKSVVLRAISDAASPTCIIASNTSSFPIDLLAADCDRPERFLGMHFFNPADVIPGVEVIAGPATAPEVVAWVSQKLIAAGKQPAAVRSSPGFISNRLQVALFLECLRCVDEGLATPEAIDTVVSTTFGFRLPFFGPFAIADMAGLDVYRGMVTTLEAAYGERFSMPDMLVELNERGDLGLKTGRGLRSYDAQTQRDLPIARDAKYTRLRDLVDELSDDATAESSGSEGGSPDVG